MGAFEEAKGKVKQAAGDLSDDPQLKQEGEAQEGKAEAQRQAREARAEARGHEASVGEAERAERAAQSDK